MAYDVHITHEPRRILAVAAFEARSAAEVDRQRPEALRKVVDFLVPRGAPPAGPAVTYVEGQRDGSLVVAAGFTVSRPLDFDGEVLELALPGGEVATTTHVGDLAGLPAAYDALQQATRAQGRELATEGGRWEECWAGTEPVTHDTRTEVFWPLRPR